MAENKKYCAGCMMPIEDGVTVCPNCYYDIEKENHAPALKINSILSGRYLIGRVLQTDSDSITYIGRDLYSDEILSITEFFPQKILSRENGESTIIVNLGYDTMFENCRESFLSLWRGIDMFKDEICVPKIVDIIESNGTVYTIKKYLDSISLSDYFEQTKKPLSWARANSAFKPILSCLAKLHNAGIIHGNISPETIHVGSDGKLHIMYFSIPQCYCDLEELRNRPNPGFSPIELYGDKVSAKPYTDVYSVMALMYYSITGLVPPASVKRAGQDTMVLPAAIANTLTNRVIDCFVKCLSVFPQNRIQTIDEIIEFLAPISERRSIPVAEAVHEVANEESAEPSEENEAYEDEETHSKPEEKKPESLLKIALTTFIVVVFACSALFCGLYTTVLYERIDIPVLNRIFSSFSFLPINKEVTDTYIPNVTENNANSTEVPTEKTYVSVPDFSAHTKDSIAANENFNERFTIIFAEDYSETVKKDSVISQSIEKGASVLSGTKITVVISLGPSPIELPNVIGMQYEEAEKILLELGFTVSKEIMENNDNKVPNEVYLTNKVAGLEFEKGTEIILSVWDEIPKKDEKNDKDGESNNKKSDQKEPATKKPNPSKKNDDNTKKSED